MSQLWDRAQYDRVYYAQPESYMSGTAHGPGWPGGRQGVTLHYTRWLEALKPGGGIDDPWAKQYAAAYVSRFGLVNTQTVVSIGSGYAWSLEFLIDDHGFDAARLVGVDTSAVIHGNKDQTEEAEIDAAIIAAGAPAWSDEPTALDPATGRGAEIKAWLLTRYGGTWPTRTRSDLEVLNETLRNAGSRKRARKAVDAATEVVDWIIVEFMLSSLTDAELALAIPNIDTTQNGTGGIGYLVATDDSISAANPEGFNRKSLTEWRAFIDSLDGGAYSSHLLMHGDTFEVL